MATNLSTFLGSTFKGDKGDSLWSAYPAGIATVNTNVGIGTTNPTSSLHVVSSSPEIILVERTTGNTNALIQYKSPAGSIYAGMSPNAAAWGVDNDNNLSTSPLFLVQRSGEIIIGGGTSTGTASQPLQVFNGGAYVSGSLGIGTTNPSDRLHIGGGNARIDGTSPNLRFYNGTSRLGYTGSISGDFYVATDIGNLIFRTNDTDRARFDSSGNLLIGTTTATGTSSQALQVFNGGAYIAGDTTNGLGIGIGVTLPSNPLDIRLNGSGASVSAIRISPTTGNNAASILYANNASSNFYTGILNNSGAVGGISGKDSLAAVVGLGTGTTPLLFVTNNTEALRIDSSQNVGIGTTNPLNRLQVNDTAQTLASFRSSDTNNSNIRLVNGTLQSVFLFNRGSGNFAVGTSGVGTDEKFCILNGGNTGIGTTIPQTTLDVNGSIKGVITSGTATNTTSGTSITYTGIPSWAKRITVGFTTVSTSGTSVILLQLGTSSGIVTTNYLGSSQDVTSSAVYSTGFALSPNVAATDLWNGQLVLTLLNSSSNLWTESHTLGRSNNNNVAFGGGSRALSGTLDRVRLTTVNGTDTFDSGSVNIFYEG